MAYIGKEPIVGNFQKCDAITVVNGQAAYTLQVSSTNVVPESANHMLVSLNGILQAPVTSFTVSGSTLTFASNLATGGVIDFVILLGNVLDLGVPSDDTVGAAQIKDDLISGTTALASEPADTDEFLVSDAGTLKRIDYSLIKGGGITEADQWRITANTNANTTGYVTSNWERNDTTGFSKIGTGLSESSGVFSFPSTGIYLINYFAQFQIHGDDTTIQLKLYTTVNNSSYTLQSIAYAGNGVNTDQVTGCASNFFIFDVTDTSNCKFKLYTDDMNGSTSLLIGDSSWTGSGFYTIRLGDT